MPSTAISFLACCPRARRANEFRLPPAFENESYTGPRPIFGGGGGGDFSPNRLNSGSALSLLPSLRVRLLMTPGLVVGGPAYRVGNGSQRDRAEVAVPRASCAIVQYAVYSCWLGWARCLAWPEAGRTRQSIRVPPERHDTEPNGANGRGRLETNPTAATRQRSQEETVLRNRATLALFQTPSRRSNASVSGAGPRPRFRGEPPGRLSG